MLRFEVTTTAAGSEMQPNAATQLGVGVQQVARRPQTQLLLARDQDDFDALDLEDNWKKDENGGKKCDLLETSWCSIAFTLAQLIIPKLEITETTSVNQVDQAKLRPDRVKYSHSIWSLQQLSMCSLLSDSSVLEDKYAITVDYGAESVSDADGCPALANFR